MAPKLLYMLFATLNLSVLVNCAPPTIDGYHMIWSDDFQGASGSLENGDKWKRIQDSSPANGEEQIYTDYASNAHLSGDGQLYIVPIRRTGAQGKPYWTSARLESYQSWYAAPGKSLIIRAEIRVPNLSSAKSKGLWPAFWALGTSIRNTGKAHVGWPTCGERDICTFTRSLLLSITFSYGEYLPHTS